MPTDQTFAPLTVVDAVEVNRPPSRSPCPSAPGRSKSPRPPKPAPRCPSAPAREHRRPDGRRRRGRELWWQAKPPHTSQHDRLPGETAYEPHTLGPFAHHGEQRAVAGRRAQAAKPGPRRPQARGHRSSVCHGLRDGRGTGSGSGEVEPDGRCKTQRVPARPVARPMLEGRVEPGRLEGEDRARRPRRVRIVERR